MAYEACNTADYSFLVLKLPIIVDREVLPLREQWRSFMELNVLSIFQYVTWRCPVCNVNFFCYHENGPVLFPCTKDHLGVHSCNKVSALKQSSYLCNCWPHCPGHHTLYLYKYALKCTVAWCYVEVALTLVSE